ncbi:MAG: hypothetical protein NT107_13885 [Planctomycetota bacterium]|nr:hypothetical protein [Planctomycetota bacterium]
MRSTILGLCALSACAVGASGLLPNRIAPSLEPMALAKATDQVRTTSERGLESVALRELEPLLQSHRDAVLVQRMRQDLLRRRGRVGLLRYEAEERLAKSPEDPLAHYLLARVLPMGAEQVAAFRRAAEAGPEELWPWIGLAHSMLRTDPSASLAIYERLYAATARQSIVAIAYARALRAMGKLPAAVLVYQQLISSGAAPGVGELGLAECAGVEGNIQHVWSALMPALRQRPYDPGVQLLVRDMPRFGINDDTGEQLLDVLREDPERFDDFARGDGLKVLVPMLARAGQSQAALLLLADRQVTARNPQLRREQRRLLLQLGDVAGFLRLLRADLPPNMLLDETNQVRGRWLRLLDLGANSLPLAKQETATSLCEALRDCGLLIEAEQAAALVLRTFPGAAAMLALCAEVRRELAFENGLRRMVYSGYGKRQIATERLPSLAQFYSQVRELAKGTLGSDFGGQMVSFSVPLVGDLLDPFADALCEHLARYNHHLTLGQRSGGVIEALMFTRISVRDLPPDPLQPLLGRCREVVGCDRDVRSMSGVLGGDLAGLALLSHYVIDFDAVREWAGSIAERQRIAIEDGGAVLTDPMPKQVAPFEALDVHWRLLALSLLQDSQLEAAVFDVVARHERRHLVDSFHYLPLESNLWRGLSLLVRSGFSPLAIEGEMERRAELAALLESPHTELVLAHIADFMSEQDPTSPHVRGFGQLGQELVRTLQQQGKRESEAKVANWHRLDRASVLMAAKTLFAELP